MRRIIPGGRGHRFLRSGLGRRGECGAEISPMRFVWVKMTGLGARFSWEDKFGHGLSKGQNEQRYFEQ